VKKVVFFTNKSLLGAKILKQMKSKNILIEAIFVDTGKPIGLGKRVKKWQRRLKRKGLFETAKLIFKRIKRKLAATELKTTYSRFRRKFAIHGKEEWLSNNYYYLYSNKVYIFENFNSKKCEQILRKIEPDIIVLGGSRILRSNIINIPNIGILNAHPGLLPKYRGIDIIPCAIYHEDNIGVTIHFVDEGIDTGGIAARKVIDITKNDNFDSLGEKAGILAGELMADTVLRIIEKNWRVQLTPQLKEEGKQYSRMPLILFLEAKKKLKKLINES